MIGVGALALPLAFTQAGLVLGTLLVVTLAFMSFLTTSYVVEAMAAANAYDVLRERRERGTLTREDSNIQKHILVCFAACNTCFLAMNEYPKAKPSKE